MQQFPVCLTPSTATFTATPSLHRPRRFVSPFWALLCALLVLALCAAPSAVAQSGCFAANFGAVGLPFDSGAATVTGGTAPYQFSITGALPSGLTLNASSGEVTGTPTATGQFAVQSTDSLGVAGQSCSITIGSLTNPATTLGLANAYNLVALTGDISDTADITGRIAAAAQVTMATTVGTALRTSDPYISLASANGGPFAIVAANGIPTSAAFNVNAGGNVYSSTSTSASFNFANEEYVGSLYSGSQLITGGSSPINFSSLQSSMSNLSTQLAGLNAYGVVCSVDNSGSIVATGGCPANPIYFNSSSQHYNPSWVVLYGTSPSLNVFNLSAAQLQNSNVNLDIEVPTGSTVIINVSGDSVTVQKGIYFQGNTVTDSNAGTILFNFPTANWVTINGQFDGVVLAPRASLNGTSQMGGVFVAASIGSTGEVHYVPFTGSLPWSSNSPALSITCAAVSTGIVGVAFDSGAMSVSGGTAPFVYSVVGTLPAGLTLDTSTGAVTGTPTAAGTFQVRVTDADGVSGTACAITINPALSVSCPTTAMGEVGLAFDSGPINVSGGSAPYSFSIVGTMPAGLTLNTSTGEITGTPTAAGTFALKVTDANGTSATTCNIVINGPLSVTCAAVTAGTVGAPFNSGAVNVTGGSAPYTYSVVGTLPAGLTLNASTGAVTGTPTAAGTFAVKVTDSLGSSNTSCNITINGPLAITCAALNTGTVGVAFNSGAMSVTGGTAPYTYSVVGTLPAGLTLNTSTGAVTGTPTAAGTFSVKVTDANGASSTSCNITINGPLQVSCAANNTGVVGTAFNSGPMTVSGGAAPYTYSVVGTLPAGLTLNTSTGAVTGTPTAAGTFAVKVTDALGNSSTSCNITITAALSSTCAAVTAGEVGVAFNSGAMSVSGGTAPYTYSIVGTLPAGLTLNASTGAVTGTPTSAGAFSVKVTDAQGVTTSACPITIHAQLSVSCAATRTGTVGVAFNSGAMTVSGGIAPYSYAIVGTLPAGLTLNMSTGSVTGTPTASGTFNVKVTDAAGSSNTACGISINGLAPLSVSCAATNSGTVGTSFNSGAMSVSGGLAPYSYSIVGTLPAGLTLNTSTGAVTGTPTATGSFNVKVTDAMGSSSSACAITIVGAGLPLAANDTATIGYWNNKNGQALINSMNGGPDATNLGTWLATNFPYLYGSHSSNNLAGKTNAEVAAFDQALFGGSAPKTSAQILGGALAAYVTNATLAGTTEAIDYGFNFSSTGTGAKTFNVGSDGAGAGLANNASYTVFSLLQQANRQVQLGDFSATAFNSIFSNINETGDLNGKANTVSPAYTLTVTPSNVTVVAGQSATATFTFSPVGGYKGTINFTCSGLPAGATCSFSPASVTTNGSNTVQTSTLKITTSASGTATISEAKTAAGPTLAGVLLLPGLMFAGVIGLRRRWITARMRGLVLMMVVGAVFVGTLAGCGSGINYAAVVGPHTVSVVATAKAETSGGSSPTQTADFTLTVVR